MEQKRLRLYKLDMKYIRDLAKKDDNVHSVSPQVGKDNRPFVGIIIVCDNKKYCIPLSSPKPKHQKMKNDIDFMKINVDGKTTVKALAESGLMLGKTESALRNFFNRAMKDGSLEGFKYAKGTIEKI